VADTSNFSNLIDGGQYGVKVDGGSNVQVQKNLIDHTHTAGIQVKNAAGVDIDHNHVMHGRIGIYAQNDTDATIGHNVSEHMGANGMSVYNNPGVKVISNRVDDVSGNGIALGGNVDALADYNRIYDTTADAMYVAQADGSKLTNNYIGSDLDGVSKGADNVMGYGFALYDTDNLMLKGNHVTGVYGNGVTLKDAGDVTLASNIITNNGVTGLFASGAGNGAVTLTGNSFIDNPTAIKMSSGTLDLSGGANTVTGGRVGLQLVPYDVGGGSYSHVAVAGNTLGSTQFSGQGLYYVQLKNGAVFGDTLDGLNASYDGVNPSSTGGVLSAGDYANVSARIHDFNSDPTLGRVDIGSAGP
jgi:parallel beta-helix repeat protein